MGLSLKKGCLFVFIGLCFGLLLMGCDFRSNSKPPAFKNMDVTGMEVPTHISLVGVEGKKYTLSDFKGKVVLLAFGFTQCPDACPATMLQAAQTMQKLGSLSDKVQVVLVTLDPERDQANVLNKYVQGFDPRFLGLTGTKEVIAQVAQGFKVFYQIVPGENKNQYTIEHTMGSYLLGPDGRVRVFVSYGENNTDKLVHDIKALLE